MQANQQMVQVLAVVLIMGCFALAEWRKGLFFPKTANPEDHRLDVAATLMLPWVSGVVLASAQALSAWAMPEHRNAWADWAWWQMVAVLLVAMTLPNICGTDSATRLCCGPCTAHTIRPHT